MRDKAKTTRTTRISTVTPDATTCNWTNPSSLTIFLPSVYTDTDLIVGEGKPGTNPGPLFVSCAGLESTPTTKQIPPTSTTLDKIGADANNYISRAWEENQALTLKRYPAQLSLTTWMCFIGAAQSAFYSVIVQHKPADWDIGFNVDLWSTLYSGIVISGIIIFVQLWCTEEKGSVFVTIFNPLSTILVAVLAYFVFGERLYMGSILGGIVVIMGLYLLLWGKDRDQDIKEHPSLASEEHENTKVSKYNSIGENLKEEP